MRKKHRKHHKKRDPAAGAAPAGEKPAAVLQPEKVSVLNPQAYQHEANNNKPNKRTTFYHKKNGVRK